jgi:PTH1 family peptidyl-tRNA hydrolase
VLAENLYLVVGLGNPGADYARTRHNAGFMLAERLAERWRAGWNYEKKFNARLARAERENGRVWLCEPQTYMNASGETVGAVAAFYRVALSRTILLVDDADLPLGQIRLRPGGSSGGHHGLESIEQHLGSRGFARLRMGIGRQDGAREITGHVLGRFSSTESALMDKVISVAAEQVETWVDAGIQKAMSQFNGAVEGTDNEREEK